MLRLTTTAATTGCGWGGRVASGSVATAMAARSVGMTRACWQQSRATMTTTSRPRTSPLVRQASCLFYTRAPALLRRPGPVFAASSGRQLRRPISDDSSSKPPPPAPTVPRRENIYTVPNFLTAARIAAAPFIGYCIVNDQPGMALGLLVTAALTDLLDGWIARRWKLHTVVGSIIDPMADKILMTVLTGSLAAQGSLPLWLAVLILGRDAGLGVSAIYYRWVSLPPPKTFARYWDFSLPSAEVHPTAISKYNTFLQLALMAATTAAPVLAPATVPGAAATAAAGGLDLTPYLTTLQYVVGVTTVWSGASYVYSKDAVKILTKKT